MAQTPYPETRNPTRKQVVAAAQVPGTLFSLLDQTGYHDSELLVCTGRLVSRKWEGVGDREPHVFMRWARTQPGSWHSLKEDHGWIRDVIAINDPTAIELFAKLS